MTVAEGTSRRGVCGISFVSLALVASVASAQCLEWSENPDGFVYPLLTTDLVYDPIRDKTIMWGSYIDTDVFYTQEYDGGVWRLVDGGPFPPARYQSSLAYDNATGMVLMFGGTLYQGSYFYPTDTWGWDGTSWQQLAVQGPRGRTECSLTLDPARGVVVLHGGVYRDENVNRDVYLNDTWEWDGNNWELKQTGSGPLGFNTTMAYDPGMGGVLAYGAQGSGGFDKSTWLWDGTQWSQLTVNSGQINSDCDMVYHEGLDRMFIVSGTNQRTWLWEWTGSDWELAQTIVEDLRLVAASYHASTDAIVVVPTFLAENNDPRWNYRTWEFHTVYPPGIDTQPSDQEVEAGQAVEFSVETSGEATAFQWFQDSTPLADDGRIIGATTAALQINNVIRDDAGEYWVTVSNSCGETESARALLAVICHADFNDDGVLDTLDVLLYLNAWAGGNSSADFNGDGTVNTLDFLAFLNAWVAGC